MAASASQRDLARLLPSGALVAVFLVIVGLAWIATIAGSNDFNNLMMMQLSGFSPVPELSFLALAGVMMGAMMLPSALPMLSTYRGLSVLDSNAREANLRAALFSGSYVFLWLAFTAAAVIVLVALGLMGMASGWLLVVPGALLVAAGLYQFTSWKSFCLSRCRTPAGFVMEHWRGGRTGALRMGLAHGWYCLGCCWVLMLVVFVTGAMSLFWMAGFSVLILVEKVWSRGEAFSKVLGAAAFFGGAGTLLLLGLSGGIP